MTLEEDVVMSVVEKEEKESNVYLNRSQSDSVTDGNRRGSFKDRMRRSFRMSRKTKSCDDEAMSSRRRRNRSPSLSYMFCSFRKSGRNASKLNDIPAALEEEEEDCPYEKIMEETASISNDTCIADVEVVNDIAISEKELNNNTNTKDNTSAIVLTNNSTKSKQGSESEYTSKPECKPECQLPPIPIYSESIISSYNVKTRYFLSKLFNIKKAFSKTKGVTAVIQEEKITTASSSDSLRSGKDNSSFEGSNGCTYQIKKSKDRSSIIITLNDENNQKRSSILVSLNEHPDRPKPSYIIPLNDMDRSSSSSVLFSGLGDDDMDLSYLIEYANQAFDGRLYSLENTRDIVGGSEDNILENGSALYGTKDGDADVCRSLDVLCTQPRISMCESLHLGDGDDDEIVIAAGPGLIL